MKLIVAFAAVACALPAVAAPPPARVAPVTDTYWGEPVVDPYRWMEARDAEFTAWLRAQDAAARPVLTSAPGYADLRREVGQVSGTFEVPSTLELANKLLFFMKRPAGASQLQLFVHDLTSGSTRLLINPEVAPFGAAGSAISLYRPSGDGRYVVVGVTNGGSEETTLRVLDTRTGQLLPDAIDRARYAKPEWDPRGDRFYYNRLNLNPPGAPPSERYRNTRVFEHVLGQDPARDRPVFDIAKVQSDRGGDAYPFMMLPDGSDAALVASRDGVSNVGEMWVAPRATLGQPEIPWRKLVSRADGIWISSRTAQIEMRPAVVGGAVYTMSGKGADRGKLVRIDLATGKITDAMPQSRGLLAGFRPMRNGLVLATWEAGVGSKLQRFDSATRTVSDLPAPAGFVNELVSDASTAAPIVAVDSWLAPGRVFAGTKPLPLTAAFPRDLSPYVADEVTIVARDGTRVPVTLMYRRGFKRDGQAPALFNAYGAYGEPEIPYLNPRILPLLDRGALYVNVHVRGGGDFGEAWHLAGKEATKPNTWRDFIDAVEAVGRLGWTSPRRSVGLGTSAGGIMIGRTVTERPDLLAAAIMNVPAADMLRFELTEGGPANTVEFGTVKTAAGYRALKAMSPYANVVPGTRYPAVLVTAGANDHRVPAWVPAKMAARLQAAQADRTKPILLRVDFDAGHGHGSTREQRDDLFTDFYAWALRWGGHPQFQPTGDQRPH